METLKSRLKEDLERELALIPKTFRQAPVIHQTIKCFLYNMVKEADLWPVPDFKPPRLYKGVIDLVCVDPGGKVKCAFAIGPVVDLKDIKSLEALEVDEKWLITYSHLVKKVQESKFFLKPGIQHLHLEQS